MIGRMENERYMRAEMDLKRVFLLFMNKLWLAVAAVVLGAVLGVGIYLAAHLIFASEKEYQSVSKIYLNFNCDPEDFNELSYNGYTWNDLLDTDPILDYAMAELPAQISREEVTTATKAEILSDIRLLTVTVTAKQPELAAQIMEAIQIALVHLGETDELFQSIEIYSTGEPEQIVWDDRTVNAALTGAVLMLIVVLLSLALYYILDDSVYVEADAKKRFGIPAVGIFTSGESGTFQSYGSEFLSNYSYLCRKLKKVTLMSADNGEDARNAAFTMEKLFSTNKLEESCEIIPVELAEESPKVYEKIRNTDGVLLTVRYGRGNGKSVERALNNLEKQDCRVIGILIVEADVRFLKKYYMCKRQKNRR
jgi:capsular polysaccharide biosynthesis protein